MEIKKTIKKAVALSVGASMVGATLMGAMAADLASYPAPFISGGSFNAVLVIGDKADARDVIGVTDIQSQLQYTLSGGSSTGTAGGQVTGGDSWLVGSSADQLEVSEDLDQARERIDASELPTLLAVGSARTQKATSPYNQYLELEDGSVEYEENTDSDEVADFLKYVSGDGIFNYTVEFTTSLESDIDNSAGIASSTGTFLTDMDDTDLTIMGKTYTILTARRTSTVGNNVELTLLGGEETLTMEEGESTTVNAGGKDYEVEVLTITDGTTPTVVFNINGVTTRELQDDQTETLKDGTVIGIKTLLDSEIGSLTGDTVRFTIGASKLVLKDTDITSEITGGTTVSVNDDTATDVTLAITGSDSNTTFKIDTIKIGVTADDNIWVPAGGKLSENDNLDTETKLILDAFDLDVAYGGLTSQSRNTIEVKNAGDDKYELVFKNVAGNQITLPLVYANTSGVGRLVYGDGNDRLTLVPQAYINDDEYFIVTDKVTNEDGHTEVVQYKGSDKVTDDSPTMKMKLLSTGETLEKPLTISGHATATFTFGGSQYTFRNASSASSKDFAINVSSAPSGVSYNKIVTQYGMLIALEDQSNITQQGAGYYGNNSDWLNASGDYINLSVVSPSTMVDSTAQPKTFQYQFAGAATDQEVGLAASTGRVTLYSLDEDTNVKMGMNEYGVIVRDEQQSGDPRSVKWTVPKVQALPQVYVVSGGASITVAETSTTAEPVVSSVQKIEVGATKLASQVTVGSTNVIAVGGPCANSVAAEIMGKPFVGGVSADTCADGFTPGKAMIKVFDTGSKVAMVVAGDTAQDTRAATTVVANYRSYAGSFKGEAVEISDTSSSKPTVSAMMKTTN